MSNLPAPRRIIPTGGWGHQREAIAPGWHLCFLHSYARRNVLAEDGLPTEGGVLPKIPLPRRMYAGSTFTFDGEIRVGDKLRRDCVMEYMNWCNSGSNGAYFSRQGFYSSVPDNVKPLILKQNAMRLLGLT